MRFLVDQNLPVRLTTLLTGLGRRADHTKLIGLADASDREVWAVAESTGAVMVSKDNDFVQLALASSSAGLLWLRVGNIDNRTLYDIVRSRLAAATSRLEAGERVVEISE